MNKLIWLSAAVFVMSACSMGGFKPAPDAEAGWRLTNFNELYPGLASATLSQYSKEEKRKQLDAFFKKRYDDFRGCNYDPIGGGSKIADACLRRKGWYQTGYDLYPENKQYEWPRTEN
ncbi:hypothetical protein V6667_01100 [Neisseria leonii]|uniref:Lipoprotein n=1 Tax=Neisseria leonii TaxID=2995413 RepID=A0A9X4E820_9NEIS|nr:hypothetical protein [Neisseria sp. 51.81]MDD9328772.1 hypothetical protein [Neisseria sp. 51.81]